MSTSPLESLSYQLSTRFDLDDALAMTGDSSGDYDDQVLTNDKGSLFVDTMPTVTIEPGHVCTVCMEAFQCTETSTGTKLPCGHKYHSTCIFTWLVRHDSCPLCRVPVQDH